MVKTRATKLGLDSWIWPNFGRNRTILAQLRLKLDFGPDSASVEPNSAVGAHFLEFGPILAEAGRSSVDVAQAMS